MSSSTPAEVAIVLLPPCSMLGIGCVAEPFALANRLSGRALYELKFYSWDGEPITLKNGLPFPVHGALRELIRCDQLFLLSERIVDFADAALFNATLTRLAQRADLLGGIDSGAWWMAAAGLLDGYRATIHWPVQGQFSERFRKIVASHHLFELDRDRFTCGGGLATLDGIVSLIGRQHGRALAEQIAEALCAERIRAGDERQRVPLASRLGERQPKLSEAVALMEANIEEPLSTDEIANLTGQSRRHLERLFKQFLDTTPSRHYLELRLERARILLQRSNKTVEQIAAQCGFSSAPYFSTVYRSFFGVRPRDEQRHKQPSAKPYRSPQMAMLAAV